MATPPVSLADAPVVDVHCHGWRTDELLALDPAGFLDRVTMTGMCLISSGLGGDASAGHLRTLTESTPLALALARRLATRLRCDPDPEALGAARRNAFAADPVGYLRALWDDAGVAALVVDEGYPQPAIPAAELEAAAGIPVHRVGRIEPWIAELRDGAATYAELEDALTAAIERAADEGAVAFKSVIAYRTGLDVQAWSRSDREAAFRRWRDDGWRETREHAKPVRDGLLRRTLEAAAAADGRPVHVHCGGGDPAIVLGHARPQDLFPLLAERIGQPVVLIHSGWPWLEEGAYVASVLPHVYLDLSIGVPWGSLAIDGKLEVLLGAAPPAKVLYGSDEASEPEVIWFAAHVGRAALERVLARAVEHDWLDAGEARRIGAGVLGGNARRLHGLPVAAAAGA
jgi:predicted TIM-barrel fold metal-dependent hydrolase